MAKNIEELNLMDDFLFQEMLGDPEYGEQAAKIILETIMQCSIQKVRVKTQQIGTAGYTAGHAIRMDVYIEAATEESEAIYDVEVQQEDTGELPQRSRYYQALIDSRLLRAGEAYKTLKPLWVIIITPMDIFEDNRMIYTFENRCIENSQIALNDGARRIFLNSKGEIGREEEIYQLLQYFECSKAEKAVTPTTRRLHQMVEKIRHDQDVGVRYLKAIEYEHYITEKATREGMQRGIEQGLQKGIEQGIKQGMEQGIEQGIKQGMARFEKLNLQLISEKRYEDLERASKDREYREQLFEEFGI